MNENIEDLQRMLKKSPACFHNLVQALCDMVCSQNQTSFLKVDETAKLEKSINPMSLLLQNISITILFFFVKAI